MELDSKVQVLKGIGPKKSKYLKKIGIETIKDMINYYPRGYSQRLNEKKLCEVLDNEDVLIEGYILQTLYKKNRNKYGGILTLLIDDGSARAEIVFFNANHLKNVFRQGDFFSFFGKALVEYNKIKLIHPEFFKQSAKEVKGIIPIYPLTGGINQNEMRKWQREAINSVPYVKEFLPDELLKDLNMCPMDYAIMNIHFPKDIQKLKEARFRLIFNELFLFQLMLILSKQGISSSNGISFSENENCEDFIESLPFSLTKGQKKTIDDILQDMKKEKPMNRLIQGDVGSGKTVVAEIALYKAVKDGYQGVIMAPTEILAQQHFQGITEAFKGFGINVGFLSSSVKTAEKRNTLMALADGSIDILVGTHAIIGKDVKFKNLGLVVTDEQHRFGVNQRKLLGAKGNSPDTLVMTATPIPRTLAVILYGELDISIIDTLPMGRQKITTKAIGEKSRAKAYEFMRNEIKKGRQCYVVAPLIEDSESLDVRSAESLYDEIKSSMKDIKPALLHGDMKVIEKDEIMNSFYMGEIDVLVSTVVIEVGINVPNATVMIIENSERFGLAQLHQLRGRVGRGSEKSYCILINNGTSEVAKERASIMVNTSDGFLISEKDLELRGPGEFFGTKQHGIPEFKLANLVKHTKTLEMAKSVAHTILDEDRYLESERYVELKKLLEYTYSDSDSVQI